MEPQKIEGLVESFDGLHVDNIPVDQASQKEHLFSTQDFLSFFPSPIQGRLLTVQSIFVCITSHCIVSISTQQSGFSLENYPILRIDSLTHTNTEVIVEHINSLRLLHPERIHVFVVDYNHGSLDDVMTEVASRNVLICTNANYGSGQLNSVKVDLHLLIHTLVSRIRRGGLHVSINCLSRISANMKERIESELLECTTTSLSAIPYALATVLRYCGEYRMDPHQFLMVAYFNPANYVHTPFNVGGTMM